MLASRIEQAQHANKAKGACPHDQLDALVNINSRTISPRSHFNELELIFLVGYSIIKFLTDRDNYTITTLLGLSGQIKVLTSRLTFWFRNSDTQFPSRATSGPGPGIRIAEDSNEHRYDVERIIKARQGKQDQRSTEVLIKWKGYAAPHNTWEPEQDVMECLPWDLFLVHVCDSVGSRTTVGWS